MLTIAPTIEERAKKAKSSRRAQGASGRLHRTEAGDWVWSSSDEEDESPKSLSNNGHDNKLTNNNSNQHPTHQQEPSPISFAANQPTNANHTITNDSTMVQNPTGNVFLCTSN